MGARSEISVGSETKYFVYAHATVANCYDPCPSLPNYKENKATEPGSLPSFIQAVGNRIYRVVAN